MHSNVEEDGGLVGVLHLFDTKDGAMHLVVDPGQVGDGGTLTNTAELIVDGTMAQADPALVGTEVGHGNATKMGANGRAAHNLGVTGVGDSCLGFLVELGRGGESVGLVDFRLRETTDEDQITVPGGLENLTRGQLRDVELLVGVTHVSVSSDHLVVEHGDEGLDTKNVVTEDEALDHVHLGATDIVVTVLFVPNSI